MHKILLVAQREYLATVRTKTFLIGVLFTPLMIGAIIGLTKLMDKESESETIPLRVLAVYDRTNLLAEQLRLVFDQHNREHPNQLIELEVLPVSQDDEIGALESAKNRVRSKRLKGLLVIDAETISSGAPCALYTNKARDIEFYRLVGAKTRSAVRRQVGADLNLTEEILATLDRSVPLEQFDVTSESGKPVDRMAGIMIPFAFMFMMFMGIFGISQGLLTSVIEEKSSRIMEVLLSGLSSFQLMSGKILGTAGVGITLMALWTSAGYFTARASHLESLLHIEQPGWLVLYYLLGFLLLASVLAALGSAVNSLKEAQSLMSPITMVMIIPMVAWFFIMQHPNSWWVVALSFFPPITPFVMVLRMCGAEEVPFWQVPATLFVLALGSFFTMWLSAKIFRVGVLMYGKPPRPRELFRWLAYK